MSNAHCFLSRIFAVLVFCLCATAATAKERALEVGIRSVVATDALHRELITVNLRKDGSGAPERR